jgi:hypothetical protein
MHDLDYVLELTDSYNCALITRDELQDEIHSCSIETIMYAVNALNEYHGHDAATAFIVVADLPLYWEPVPIPGELTVALDPIVGQPVHPAVLQLQ